MSDELTALREEIAALRADLTALQKSHRRLLDRVMEMPEEPDEPWPEYLHFDAGCIAVRSSRQRIPLMITSDEDGAAIAFYDQNHCMRMELSVGKDGAQIELHNAKGDRIFQLRESPDASGQLCVCDPEGRPRAGMRVNDQGGVVNVIDEEGKAQAFIGCTDEGGHVYACNAMHQASATLKATARGGHVCVHEPSGQLMAFLSASTETGCVSVYGPHGEQAAGLVGSESGGQAIFHDVEGKAIAHLP
jgi:hypothetical protein